MCTISSIQPPPPHRIPSSRERHSEIVATGSSGSKLLGDEEERLWASSAPHNSNSPCMRQALEECFFLFGLGDGEHQRSRGAGGTRSRRSRRSSRCRSRSRSRTWESGRECKQAATVPCPSLWSPPPPSHHHARSDPNGSCCICRLHGQ
jgi:hypothetical protein